MKRVLLIPAFLAALSLPARAQCVMCYRTAHAQNNQRSRVMNAGILVLGVPPFLILAGFAVLLRKRSRTGRDE
jgi:hypothetical protein